MRPKNPLKWFAAGAVVLMVVLAILHGPQHCSKCDQPLWSMVIQDHAGPLFLCKKHTIEEAQK